MSVRVKHHSLLSLATSACLVTSAYSTTAMAEGVDFYGSLRLMLEKAKDVDDPAFKDALTRVGVSGSYDVNDGLKAVARYEVGLDLADDEDGDSIRNLRQANIGLASDSLGTVLVGKTWSPFYETVAVISDYLWWNSAPVYYTLEGGLHVAESIHYTSPSLGGFTFKALHQVEDGDDSNEDVSQVGASYKVGQLTLAAGYVRAADDQNVSGAGAAFSAEKFYVNAAFVSKEDVGSGVDALVGFPLGKHLFTLGLSEFSADESDNDFTATILAYQYKIHSSVLVWTEFMAWDGSLYGVEDANTLNAGINFNF